MRSKTSCTLGFITNENWRFFCAEKKVCRGGLRILSAVLLGSFEPLSLPLITDKSVQPLNWNRPKWFSPVIFATLVLWSFLLRQVRVNNLVEFFVQIAWICQKYRRMETQLALSPLLTSICYCHWDDGIPKQRKRRLGDLYVNFPSWKVHSLPNKLRKVYSFFNKLTPDRLN